MKKWTMALCAGLLLFTTSSVDAKPNNPNKQHQKAWIAQHKAQKQQEKFQREQYKNLRKQQKEYEKQQRMANRPYGDDDYGYRNYPQQSTRTRPQANRYPQQSTRTRPQTNGYPQQSTRTRPQTNPRPQQTNNGGWNLGDILGAIGI